MRKAYSELSFWPDDADDSTHYCTLRLVGWDDADPTKTERVEIECSRTQRSVVIPISVFYEMAKELPGLEDLPEPLPFAEEVD